MTKNKYLVISFLFVILFIILNNKLLNISYPKILSWDEVDYVNASKKGLIENIFEFKSDNIIEYLNIGIKKISTVNKIENITINKIDYYKLEHDVFKLRHYHPPLLNIIINSYDKIISKYDDVNYNYFKKSLIIFIFLIYLFFFFFFREDINFINYSSLILVLILFFQSNLFLSTISKINYHTLFGFIIFLYLFLFDKFIKKRNIYTILLLSFSLFLLFFTLETALFISILPFIYLFFFRKKLFYNYIIIKDNLKIIYFYLLFLFLLWPANIYNLSILKTYSIYFYRIFINSNKEYSDLDIFSNLIELFYNNYIIFIIFFVFLFKYLYNWRKDNAILLDLLIFVIILYSIFIIPFTHHPSYLFPSLVLITFFLCFEIIKTQNFKFIILFNLIIFIIITINISLFNIDNISKKNNFENLFKFINLENNKVYLADGAHIFDYYSNKNRFINLEVYDKYNPKFYVKYNDDYYKIDNLLKIKYFDGIFIQKNRNFNKIQYEMLLKYGYKLDNRFKNYYFYY